MLKPAAAVALLLLAAQPQAARVWKAPQARQGVAVDAAHFYAVDNSAVTKFERASGRRLAVWKGDPASFRHLNSCVVVGVELVCANSNYPRTPMRSFVEVFDPARMQHLRTVDLGEQGGSLTFVQWHGERWWAGFANYDGRGGEKGRDHRATKLVRFDPQWKPEAVWTFPPAVLDRMKPYSASGGAFGPDGLLYVTGHDRPEVYALTVPPDGGVLQLTATYPAPINGQGIAFDPTEARTLFGIRRGRGMVVAFRLPPPQR